jgi:hypothetical protein
MEVSGQFHAPAPLPPEERGPFTHWIVGWVGCRASLGAVVKRKIPSLPMLGIDTVANVLHRGSMFKKSLWAFTQTFIKYICVHG